MRPLAVLNAIVFGSAAAITFGLLGVVVIFLVLKGSNPAMDHEFPALVRSSAVFGSEPVGAAEAADLALVGAGGHVGGSRWHSAVVLARVSRRRWGKPPNWAAALEPFHAHSAARDDPSPTLVPVEAAAVVGIETTFDLLGAGIRGTTVTLRALGRFHGPGRNRRKARGFVVLVRPAAKPFGEPHSFFPEKM